MAMAKIAEARLNEYRATAALITGRNNLSAKLGWISPTIIRKAHKLNDVCLLQKPNQDEVLPPYFVGSKLKLKKAFHLSDVRAEQALTAAHALRTGKNTFELHPMRDELSIPEGIPEWFQAKETGRPKRK